MSHHKRLIIEENYPQERQLVIKWITQTDIQTQQLKTYLFPSSESCPLQGSQPALENDLLFQTHGQNFSLSPNAGQSDLHSEVDIARYLYEASLQNPSEVSLQSSSEVSLQSSSEVSLERSRQIAVHASESLSIAILEEQSDARSESEVSEFAPEKRNSQKKRRSRKNNLNQTDLNRNNFPNITRNAIKLVYEVCDERSKNQPDQQNSHYKALKNYANKMLQQKTSSRAWFMRLNEKQGEQMTAFIRMFERLLRKRYMINALKNGRMQKSKLDNYIKTKNKEVLYILTQSCEQDRT